MMIGCSYQWLKSPHAASSELGKREGKPTPVWSSGSPCGYTAQKKKKKKHSQVNSKFLTTGEESGCGKMVRWCAVQRVAVVPAQFESVFAAADQ